jgi:cysteinyl-tRNA synthetase
MSLKYLGETIDIHCGGQDLIFPHHENEIAQSECFTGKKPFARIWMHNGLFQLGEEKMSKSIGNIVGIKQVLEKHSADGFRVFVLGSHYRNPLTFSEEAIDAAERGLERLTQALNNEPGPVNPAVEKVDARLPRLRFTEVMDDDFNTPQAMAILFDLAKDINRAGETGADATEARHALRDLSGVLGLTLKAAEQTFTDAAPFIELLLKTRKKLRDAKQFALADEIRTTMLKMGLTLEDTNTGTIWKRKK